MACFQQPLCVVDRCGVVVVGDHNEDTGEGTEYKNGRSGGQFYFNEEQFGYFKKLREEVVDNNFTWSVVFN